MRTVLILGAGAAQIPLIRAAKAMGCRAVTATIPGDYPGIPEADAAVYADISDPAAVTAAARELRPDAVTTCCMETGLRAQAAACAALGLPGPSPEAAEISVNKRAMKRAFAARGVRSAPFFELYGHEDLDAAIAALGFPLVIKAVDLQGSRGVYVVRSAAEAHAAMGESLAVSGCDYCLAEAFIPGENIGAEAFVQNGEILFVLPDGTLSKGTRVNIPAGHYAPLDRPAPVLDAVRREAEKAIRACGIDNCAVNLDLVLQGDEPWIIELTARAGATTLPELVSVYYGLDYYRMILLAALGEDARPYFARRLAVPRAGAGAMLTAPAPGTLRAVTLPDPLPEDVADCRIIARPGDAVRPFEDSADRLGQLVVAGEAAPDCLARLEELLSQIRIEIEP